MPDTSLRLSVSANGFPSVIMLDGAEPTRPSKLAQVSFSLRRATLGEKLGYKSPVGHSGNTAFRHHVSWKATEMSAEKLPAAKQQRGSKVLNHAARTNSPITPTDCPGGRYALTSALRS
ncbi:hypothetical protein Bbelb_421080 [Branchiostoma belcheri]|nr:hypothetical protein Bbelb_421080 [Branchiostoma belcheri]